MSDGPESVAELEAAPPPPEARLSVQIRTVQVMVAEVQGRLGRKHPDFLVLVEVVRRLNRISTLLEADR